MLTSVEAIHGKLVFYLLSNYSYSFTALSVTLYGLNFLIHAYNRRNTNITFQLTRLVDNLANFSYKQDGPILAHDIVANSEAITG